MKFHQESDSDTVDDTPIYQMVYCSTISYHALFELDIFKDISEKTYKYNESNGITAVLCFGNCLFLHYVEGNEEALTNLKNLLLTNKLYTKFHICDFSKIESRRFSGHINGYIVMDRFPYKVDTKLENYLPFTPMSWSAVRQLELFDCIERNVLVDKQLKFGRFDSLVLRCRLLLRLGSEVLTTQQMYVSFGLLFCLMVISGMSYIVLID